MNREDREGDLLEADLREELEQMRRFGEAKPHPHLAYIDDDHARNTLARIITSINSDPDYTDYSDSNLQKIIANKIGGEAIREAVSQENIGESAFIKGKGKGANSVFNISEYIRREWRSRIDGGGVQKVLYHGDEGSGKTNGMFLEGFEIAPDVIRSETDKKKVLGLANNDVQADTTKLDEYMQISSTSELDDLLEKYGRDNDEYEVILCLDEGDQLFSGFGSDIQRSKELSDRFKLFRHNGWHILITSQKKIAPEIRDRFQIRHKPDDRDASKMWLIEKGGLNSKGEPEKDMIISRTSNFPETSVEYGGAGVWEHDVGDDEEENNALQQKLGEKQRETEDRLLNLYENTDMSYADIADTIDMRESTVGDKIRRAKKRKGTYKKSFDECRKEGCTRPNRFLNKDGYCKDHR